MDKLKHLSNIDIHSAEEQYKMYLENPESIESSWKFFFDGFEFAKSDFNSNGTLKLDNEFKVLNLIQAYRQRGHLFTKTNPVRIRRKYRPTLDLENFGLSEKNLTDKFQAGNQIGIGVATLKQIIAHLQKTYCESIGVEYLYMRHPEVVKWLQDKMEKSQNKENISSMAKQHVFYHLKLAVGFENFIHKKFVGQKRFSLEGAESLIPALDAVIEKGADLGINEFVIGMAHRGRLNVLSNILQKPYEKIFNEFLGKEYTDDISLGDVKYHLGFENRITTDNGKSVKLSLLPNPSHLEAVGPVVEGMSRSKIDATYQNDYSRLAPIIIHGDAAIAGQGVVYETAQMAQLPGYKTGGTIHFVINNQVGFTTNYLDARSSTYCTDVAKVTRSPVFHVNGDDPEALIYTMKLAVEFRQKFNSDVFIDLLCYRKYGHNEGDEPRFTQPTLYSYIAKHNNPRDIYAKYLVENGVMKAEEVKNKISQFNQLLEQKFDEASNLYQVEIQTFLKEEYQGYQTFDWSGSKTKTSFDSSKLLSLAKQLTTLPSNYNFFKKVHKMFADRSRMIEEDSYDWAMAEQLAYASLLTEEHSIRISGQDSERGTFSHRHAALVVDDMNLKYFPLANLTDNGARFQIFNSPLNEYGVLGFEYGHALAQPNTLTIWEAQYGDFSNVAQVVFDQYIASAEEKWNLKNNLVLYLPHGYEGQGPEHSSARIERLLSLAASNNMQILNLTTPSNLFHALRRQLKWNYRLPLVIFTPKSLLRHPDVRSSLDELANGEFKEIIDNTQVDTAEITEVVFTMGKLYFDLKKRKEELAATHVAIIRVEQLYPLPEKEFEAIKHKYTNATRWVWAQDEPENMGAWPFLSRVMNDFGFEVIARKASGSPAGGLMEQHIRRQERLLNRVFNQ